MFVIALTGGIGAGKSEAARLMQDRGAVVLDLDRIATDLYVPGSRILSDLAAAFGEDILDDSGSVDRTILADRAFGSPESAATLGEIVHSYVVEHVRIRLEAMAVSDDPAAVVVLEVPMLVETPGLAEMSDLIVTVEASEETRLSRAVARGMGWEDVVRRMHAQSDRAARVAISDVVLENEGVEEGLAMAIDRLWEERVEGRGD